MQEVFVVCLFLKNTNNRKIKCNVQPFSEPPKSLLIGEAELSKQSMNENSDVVNKIILPASPLF